MASIVLLYVIPGETRSRETELHDKTEIRSPKVPFAAQNIVFNLRERDKHKQ